MNKIVHYRKQRMAYQTMPKGKRPRGSAYVSAYVWVPVRMPSYYKHVEYKFISRAAFIARVLGFIAFVLVFSYAIAGSI